MNYLTMRLRLNCLKSEAAYAKSPEEAPIQSRNVSVCDTETYLNVPVCQVDNYHLI
jgi:hypothetical protein